MKIILETERLLLREFVKEDFEHLALKKIVSSAHVDNIASRRVMEKLGLKFKDFRFHYSCMQAYYEMLPVAYIALYK